MLLLALMMNAALATTPGEGEDCGPKLELTDDRGVDFYGRIATAVADWYQASPDPRRPQVLNYNVIEVRHGADRGGIAIVELQTKLGKHRLPVLVRVQYERDQITAFALANRGFKELIAPNDASGGIAKNAAMAKLLSSTEWPVKDLTAKVLSSSGYPNLLSEVLVSALVNHIPFEKVYVVFVSKDGDVRVDDSGTNRYPYAMLARNFERLLLGRRKDPTLKITAIDRQSLDTWRVLYSLGKVERVKDEDLKPTFGDRPANYVRIGPTGNLSGRVVLKGDGLMPRVQLLRVDKDHKFSLTDERRR